MPDYVADAKPVAERIRLRRAPRVLPEQIQRLRRSFWDGDLVLFAGSGASLSAGLPTWNDLIARLFTTTLLTPDGAVEVDQQNLERYARLYRLLYSRYSMTVQARYVRQHLGDLFLDRVRQELYSFGRSTSELLQAIARLCVPVVNAGGVRAVVTYNFDDLLERNIRSIMAEVRPIYREDQAPEQHELPVYHVHGYLPQTPESPDDGSPNIVFSEEAYHRQFHNPYTWENLVQLRYLRENVALFVGMSLTDPNIRRLLDIVPRQRPDRRHIAILRGPSPADLVRDILHAAGAGDRAHELAGASPEGLHEMIQAVRLMEEEVFDEMGVEVIWVDDFADIPPLLNQIRKRE
ncbi:MAG: SIR2 family protein [Chloroflexi bacterium]|nr:SIR2 family protein [Chloroflexota bacterium]